MGLIRFSASILALLSVVLFGFCAFSLRMTETYSLSEKAKHTSENINSFIEITPNATLNRAFYTTVDEQKPDVYDNIMPHFNVRMEKINDLRMRPRCVDR